MKINQSPSRAEGVDYVIDVSISEDISEDLKADLKWQNCEK